MQQTNEATDKGGNKHVFCSVLCCLRIRLIIDLVFILGLGLDLVLGLGHSLCLFVFENNVIAHIYIR